MRMLQAVALVATGAVAGLGAATLSGNFATAHGVEKTAAARMIYVKDAQNMEIKSMGMPGIKAFLQDVVASDDPRAPISCGLFRLEHSAPLTYNYTYDESKIILDGVMTISDGTNSVDAKKGDVLFFPKGSTITFTTPSSGLGFICGQRERDNT